MPKAYTNSNVLLHRIFITAMASLFVFIALIFQANAQEVLAQVQSTATGSVADGSNSQKKIDTLDDQTAELVMEYRASVRQLEELREYNAQLEKLIKAQREEMVKIRQEIEDVTTIDRTIIPHMFKMIDGLEAFVNLDTPFLIAERKARVARLRDLMDRSDANPAEKYRKILEAFEIENEYGRTIEAYEGELTVDGVNRTVNFLRLGRVSWLYQTLDGEESGVWSQADGDWVDLDGDFDAEIRTNLRIAREQAAPNLMVVPLFGANGGN
jgi:hypothetical protein